MRTRRPPARRRTPAWISRGSSGRRASSRTLHVPRARRSRCTSARGIGPEPRSLAPSSGSSDQRAHRIRVRDARRRHGGPGTRSNRTGRTRGRSSTRPRTCSASRSTSSRTMALAGTRARVGDWTGGDEPVRPQPGALVTAADVHPQRGAAFLRPVKFLLNWGRRYSLWLLNFGLACCGIELIAASMSKHDFIRFGVIPFAHGPRQGDLLIIAGTGTDKMVPPLKRVYEQMPEPKYVISFGSCANVGGPYWDSYSVTKGVDQIMPVD